MSEVLFCDWEAGSGDFDERSFFDLADLTDYNLIFFDPLHFARKNGFKDKDSELWAKEFVSVSEPDFRQFLGRIRMATRLMHDFIDSGGIWVIRCRLPNSYIKVRKKKVGGGGEYTQSVVSPFFWLEEFLGKYSFQYGTKNGLRFLDCENSLYDVFVDAPVDCPQTQNAILKGKVQVLADNHGHPGFPTISRVSFPPGKGEIYLIPRFPIEDEQRKLVEAFARIREDRKHQPFRPDWLDRYDMELELADPYTSALEEVDGEIERLKRTGSELVQKQAEIRGFTGLLYKTGEELTQAVENAFKLMDFYLPEPPSAVARAQFDFYLRDRQTFHVVGIVASSKEGPIPPEEFERLTEKIESCQLKDKPKGILVANACVIQPPDKRGNWFSDEIVENNLTREFCLLTTLQLFEMVCYLLGKTESPIIDATRESLRKDIVGCDSVFEINRGKYFAHA